jgi:hypothetical protein
MGALESHLCWSSTQGPGLTTSKHCRVFFLGGGQGESGGDGPGAEAWGSSRVLRESPPQTGHPFLLPHWGARPVGPLWPHTMASLCLTQKKMNGKGSGGGGGNGAACARPECWCAWRSGSGLDISCLARSYALTGSLEHISPVICHSFLRDGGLCALAWNLGSADNQYGGSDARCLDPGGKKCNFHCLP